MYLNDHKNIFLTSNRYECHKTQNNDADYKSGEKVAEKFYNKVINIKVTKIVGFHLLVL